MSTQVSSDKVRLNLGCGQTKPEGWVNADCSLNSWLQKIGVVKWLLKTFTKTTIYGSSNSVYMDLNRKWGYEDNSVDIVYSSHALEHLSVSGAQHFMREAYRVLRPGGIIRIVVPDLYALSKTYVKEFEEGNVKAANEFLDIANLHLERAYEPGQSFLKKILNCFQGYPHQHKFMYDRLNLKDFFETNGFKNCCAASYGESEYISEIKDVEYTQEGVVSIYLEGKK